MAWVVPVLPKLVDRALAVTRFCRELRSGFALGKICARLDRMMHLHPHVEPFVALLSGAAVATGAAAFANKAALHDVATICSFLGTILVTAAAVMNRKTRRRSRKSKPRANRENQGV